MKKKILSLFFAFTLLANTGCDLLGNVSISNGTSSNVESSKTESSKKDETSSSSSSVNPYKVTSISKIHASLDPVENISLTGRIIAKSKSGFLIYDGTGKIFYYTNEEPNVNINDYVTVEGDTVLYGASSKTHEIERKYKTHQFNSESAKYSTFKEDFELFSWNETAIKYTGVDVQNFEGPTGTYVTMNVSVYKSNNYYNCIPLTNDTYARTVSLAYPLDEMLMNVDFTKAVSVSTAVNIKLTGVILYLTSSFNDTNIPKFLNILVTEPLTLNNGDIDDDKPNNTLIDLYSINDYHGRISENANENEPGIAKLATYLDIKKALNPEGYVLLNSGDFWQDTYESGTNKGALLTECLDVMEFETFTLGNHEFDWGVDKIESNKTLTNTTFLGANIYEYPDTSMKSSLAESYKIIERNGLKIGIVGAIGESQITSITSRNWDNLVFKNHVKIVQDASDELRNEQGCDIVVLSFHGDYNNVNPSEMSKLSPVSNEKYFDAVFLGHTHQRENEVYNGVPFVQAGSHGCNVGHIQLAYEDGKVSYKASNYEGYGQMNSLDEDVEVKAIVDKYLTEEFYQEKNEVIGSITGANTLYSEIGNILAKATYDVLVEEGIEVDIVINNGARDSAYAGEMTREKVFNMIPFTNETIVAENISGQDIYNECVTYTNNYYKADPNMKVDVNATYTVACIDYMMLHKNTNRNYNYFPSYSKEKEIYVIKDYCADIVCDYLVKHGTIDVNDYIGANYSGL